MSDRPLKKCEHCGWESEADQICGACGANLYEERPDMARHSSAR